ncbi:amidohydrolase [bacterium]|nr:amidohydrolase [bacterium]
MNFRKILPALISLFLFACGEIAPTQVDTIVYGKKIYLCNDSFETAEAMAIKEGRIVATGSRKEIEARYQAENIEEFNAYIYPGFIDAHSHFYGYGLNQNKVNLIGTKSWNEVINRTEEFAEANSEGWILGRGWDQNDWTIKDLPYFGLLNEKFPDRPVFLKRVDGHAAIANSAALKLAGIDKNTTVAGGEVYLSNGELTGLLIDNAVNLIEKVIPKVNRNYQIQGLLRAEENCIKSGLTCVCDAGLDRDIILLMDSLHKTGDLKIRIYAMCNPSEENFKYFSKNGAISTNNLQVSSFKIYADGALGSYGAMLRAPYCDRNEHHGLWVTPPDSLAKLYSRIYNVGFQANTHCIGDSANHLVLKHYANLLQSQNDKRWRIEHAQVVSAEDMKLFNEYSIIPSVQPTHATSDMYWAEDRLCSLRMSDAYAYKTLLDNSPYIALGTDFPVEDISPIETFISSVYRQDANHYPERGFQMQDALSARETLLGMTLWAAKANFMEDRIGSLEKGKLADFVILDSDLMQESGVRSARIVGTYMAGKAMN